MKLTARGARFLASGAELAVGAVAVAAEAADMATFSLVHPILAPSVVAIIEEFGSRRLGDRENRRAAGVLLFATMRLKELEAQGQAPRDDGFFSGSSASRSSGEEIIEAVMNAARDTHEEKKLKFLGNLLANIAIDTKIDRSFANELIGVASSLTFTQLCILFVAVNKHRYRLREKNYRPAEKDQSEWALIVPASIDNILYQVLDLWSKHLVYMGENSSMFPVAYSLIPSEMSVSMTAAYLYTRMQLFDLHLTEVDEVARMLGADIEVKHAPLSDLEAKGDVI